MTVDRSAGIQVPAAAYPYLQMQRGAIADMKGDQATWLTRYAEQVFSEFDSIAPYLPTRCDAILDVGSGLGGIDALLNQHYGGECRVTLLDGVSDRPFCESHAKTFNHMGVAQQFLAVNGVKHFDYIDANASTWAAPRFFDLVVSFKSWCFHYEPAKYMDLVINSSIAKQTKIIVDVRRDKPEWLADLRREFQYVDTIYSGTKFNCMLFQAQ